MKEFCLAIDAAESLYFCHISWRGTVSKESRFFLLRLRWNVKEEDMMVIDGS